MSDHERLQDVRCAAEPAGAPTSELQHPTWCSPDRCELLREVRGLGDHRSAEYVLPREANTDPLITVWLTRFGFESASQTDTWINVRFAESDRLGEPETVVTHTLPVVVAAHLSGTLTHLAELALDEEASCQSGWEPGS